jgi:hypothetical protein
MYWFEEEETLGMQIVWRNPLPPGGVGAGLACLSWTWTRPFTSLAVPRSKPSLS